jgi:rhomboid family GlyGly-CTERM serine protease
MPARHTLAGSAGRWSLVFFVFTLCAQFASDATGGWQFGRSAFAAGAWWQLASSQWVHFNSIHAAVNAAAMALMLVTFERLVDARIQFMALLGGYVGVALVVALDSTCSYYAGASGALHGLFTGNVVALLLGQRQQAGERSQPLRLWAALLLAGLIAKLMVQSFADDSSTVSWLGFATYHPAHQAGAAGGAVAVLLALAWRRSRLSAHDPNTGAKG